MIGKNVKYYCCEDLSNIEDYKEALENIDVRYQCHHRFETHNSDGERCTVDITKEELIALNMYYNRPASELIFLTPSEHLSLHKYGKHPSEDVCKKISEGKTNKHPSEESCKKMSESAIKRWTSVRGRKCLKH